jgi:alpha-galactosidase
VEPRGATTRPSLPSLLVTVEPHAGGFSWRVANDGATAVTLDAVRVEVDLGPARDPVRAFLNGYQSWSPTGSVTVGEAEDPSRAQTLEFMRAMHHADPGVADAGEVRSEQVTVVRSGSQPALLIGALGGGRHSTTMRIRVDDGRVVVTIEAWLGGARLDAHEHRDLHPVSWIEGDDAPSLLAAWAGRAGEVEAARVGAPFQVGWCSWYHWFERVTEQHVRDNLARAGDWPFDVFQVDDGYQRAIGDWLDAAPSFPGGVDGIARSVSAAGRRPGLWLAPFLAAPDSRVAARHPDWMARSNGGDEPLVGMYNPAWGGFMWALDVTRPEVLDHLEHTARALREMGFEYLKLDFTFSAALAGRYADASSTPAERVRAAYSAVRRGAGDDAFVLACGCPLGAVVGIVDGMRIGPDVAPSWEPPASADRFAGYEASAPSTRHALRSTLARAGLHRRLWLNDPDCLMLRREASDLTAAQAESWAQVVGRTGGMVLVSDDLALLGAAERGLLTDVIAAGRSVDAAAAAGDPPRCPDLLDTDEPTTIESAGRRLTIEPASGVAL